MLKNLINQKFGLLTVIEPPFSLNGRSRSKCRCECGTEIVVMSENLVGGNTKSCGCQRCYAPNQKHGLSKKLPEYGVWKAMRQRCMNANSPFYSRYGGRGISIDVSWNSFETFLADMGSRPSDSHTLDRINNDGNYEKRNCRWATKKEQANNRNYCVLLEYDGKIMNMSQWSEYLGIKQQTLWGRVQKGWSTEKVLTEKVKSRPKNTVAIAAP